MGKTVYRKEAIPSSSEPLPSSSSSMSKQQHKLSVQEAVLSSSTSDSDCDCQGHRGSVRRRHLRPLCNRHETTVSRRACSSSTNSICSTGTTSTENSVHSVSSDGVGVLDDEHARISPPASICSRRVMSAAVVTSSEADHKFLSGRPRILVGSEENEDHACDGDTEVDDTSSRLSSQSLFTEDQLPQLQPPPSLRREAWSEATASDFKVRGAKYLTNKKKFPSDASVFRLLRVDVVQSDEPLFEEGLCSQRDEWMQHTLREEQRTGQKLLPAFVFAVNLCVPRTASSQSPISSPCYHWVAYFGLDDVSLIRDPTTPLGRTCEPFFFGDDDGYRKARFKLIPKIVEGNFLVRNAVGSRPSILGRKLRQNHIKDRHFGGRFMETIVDITSNPVATKIVKLSLGYAESLVVDMMFVIEGTDEKTLPERILGGVRMKHVDFKRTDGKREVRKFPHEDAQPRF